MTITVDDECAYGYIVGHQLSATKLPMALTTRAGHFDLKGNIKTWWTPKFCKLTKLRMLLINLTGTWVLDRACKCKRTANPRRKTLPTWLASVWV